MAEIGWQQWLLGTCVPFLVTFIILPAQIRFMKKKEWVGHDIHKAARPAVAESGGLSILLGITAGVLLLNALLPDMWLSLVSYLASIGAAALIGIIDDKLKLSAFKKIGSVIFATIPIIILYLFTSVIRGQPPVPFLGWLQVTILYIPFIPGFLTVLMNAVNMLEGYNGEGSGTSIVVNIVLLVSGLITGALDAVMLALPLLGSLLAFFYYNRYPAKVFPGDIGTLGVGMALGCIAIIGNLEFVLIVSIIPHILNAFHVIRSVHGFKESSTIKVKDIEMLDGDLVAASTRPDAPLTLPRIIVARKPLDEARLVNNIIALTCVSGALGILSAVLTRFTVDDSLGVLPVVVATLVTAACIITIAIGFPSIRGLTIVIVTVYGGLLLLLLFIDIFVVEIGFFNWLVAGLLAAAGLVAWYMLSTRYFKRITTSGYKETCTDQSNASVAENVPVDLENGEREGKEQKGEPDGKEGKLTSG